MCTPAYLDVLMRLKQERLKNQLVQEVISQRMKMSQGYYSKAESGERRFSYYEIQCLRESPIDLHYIFTGKRAKNVYG